MRLRKLKTETVRLLYNGEWCDVLSCDDFGNYTINMHGYELVVNMVNTQGMATKEIYTLEGSE